MADTRPLYIVMMSVHGLVRGEDMELGRDADTGGQVKYVVELARALARDPRVEQVDLLTRRVYDAKVDDVYHRREEPLADGARIVRIDCGPRRYLRKEVLWPYLDIFVDGVLQHLRSVGRVPDVVHGHYADAGYVGAHVSGVLGIPFVFTGHSLGRVKEQRLLAKGMRPEAIESQFNMRQRIEAEEIALDNANFVVASTHQEVDEQYALYHNYEPDRMTVIPPGVDLSRFKPPGRARLRAPIVERVERFLAEPAKPMILAMARPDPRKNLAALLKAYGTSPELRERANLVLVAGSRDDIADMEKSSREVMTEILLLIDRYDLYGKVAYPKFHAPDDVPVLYQMAGRSKGLFVNPALTEPFGLTLIEAAASGVPVVATHDGGPTEILSRCENGLLVDPLDVDAIRDALVEAFSNASRWRRWRTKGLTGAKTHFSWVSHAKAYLREVHRVVKPHRKRRALGRIRRNRLVTADRFLVCDVDDSLVGDDEALHRLLARMAESKGQIGFGVATGRTLESCREALERHGVPTPDVIISAVGSEMHYGPDFAADRSWARHLDYRWDPERVREVMATLVGYELQEDPHQRTHKVSYYFDRSKGALSRAELTRTLRENGLRVNAVYSHGQYLDVLPVRASKGKAVRYLALKWGLPIERVVTVGQSGNDEEMLTGANHAVVVGNYSPEIKKLKGRPRIRFATGAYANGVLEGLEHYDFFGDFVAPDEHRDHADDGEDAETSREPRAEESQTNDRGAA